MSSQKLVRKDSQASKTSRSRTVAWDQETEERLLSEQSNDDQRGEKDESHGNEQPSSSPPVADGAWYEMIGYDNNCCKVLSCFDRFVILESSRFRRVWEIMLLLMLLYIGIVFPFRLSFYQFKLNTGDDDKAACEHVSEGPAWEMIEIGITIFFWIDLFLNFFLSYRRQDDKEECRFPSIAANYLTGAFWLNFVACLPPEAFQPIVAMLRIDPGGCASQSGVAKPGDFNQIARMGRLQRISRLARLARLLRLFKITSFMRKSSLAKQMNEFRTWRMINLVATLWWVVHLLACGWFLCAALHTDHTETWVGRREIDNSGTNLLGQNAWLQWAHAMYFVLTVFTSVGFGDMSAQTAGEIVYVCIVMLVGAVVHSIIISEMINLVSEVDEETKWRRAQKNLFEGFGKHAWLQDATMDSLVDSVNDMEMGKSFDREKMRKFLVSGLMPPRLLVDIPEQLFNGLLIRNRFMRNCGMASHDGKIPTRFSLLLSTMLTPVKYGAEEVVFQVNDHAFNMYFVLHGTFAYVADPGENGGVDSVQHTANVAKLGAQPRIVVKCDLDSGVGGGTSSLAVGPRKSDRKSSRLLGGLDFMHMSSSLSRVSEEKDESILRIDPPESERDYSSGGPEGAAVATSSYSLKSLTHVKAPLSSMLGQQESAWTVDSFPGQWMNMDLGSLKSVCGVIIQGHPSKEEWVSKVRVSVALNDRSQWKALCEVELNVEDNTTIVEIEFGKSEYAKVVRIEPLEWNGEHISMRAGVLVTQQNLYPYMFFGKHDYFGEQILTGVMRPATVRCEAPGQLLLLHKGDIAPGNNGGGLLSEFPQFRGVLLAELWRREAKRRRMLKKLTKEWPRPSYQHYAAAIIQRWSRQRNKGSTPTGLNLEYYKEAAARYEEVHKEKRDGDASGRTHRQQGKAKNKMRPDGDPSVPIIRLESKVNKLQTDMTELRSELRQGLAEIQTFVAGVQREQSPMNVREQPPGSAKGKHNKML